MCILMDEVSTQMADVHPDGQSFHTDGWRASWQSLMQMSGSCALDLLVFTCSQNKDEWLLFALDLATTKFTDGWAAPCTRSLTDEWLHALDRWQMSGSMHSIAKQNITVHVHEWLHNSQNKIMCRTPKSLFTSISCNLPLQIQTQERSVSSITINQCSLFIVQQNPVAPWGLINSSKISTSFFVFKSFRRKWNITVVAACLRYSIVAHYHSAHFSLRWFNESFRRSLFHLLRPCEFTKITIIQQMRRLWRQNVHQQQGGRPGGGALT